MLKVLEIHGGNEDDGATYELNISRDGESIQGVSFVPLWECPEDATLERSLGDVYSVIDIFKLGYEAGKNNEEVVYETVNEEDIEESEDDFDE